ncbi:MAG: Flp pilus assembly complex ATPase component TadA [Nitrospirae bacterium]|nr:Flp pilus assembly complex ATPase component TadA [Nitrospirota bacterium]
MLIGEWLIELYGLRREDLDRALELQRELGGYLGQILIGSGLITEQQLMAALSRQLGLPVFDREGSQGPSTDAAVALPADVDLNYLIDNNFVPVDNDAGLTVFATNDPMKGPVVDYLTKKLEGGFSMVLATEQSITELSKPFKDSGKDVFTLFADDNPESLKEMATEAPVIKFLNNLLNNAVELRSSDIHLEPSETINRIKIRIDGVLHESDTVNEKIYLAVVSRIKLLAGLDIAEKRLPQDGKFSTKIASTLIDVRVSSIPFAVGEGIVMRLLYRERLSFDITKLGIEADMAPLITDLVRMPYGIVLVTGPTGSGKTTTLYSMLSTLDRREKKIITVEDPVEYRLEGINQIQVKDDIGLGFAASLRSILRHDPDVIMIGEIRDPETAQVAVQSALTGHLVLSTLHTNDAPSSLFRLIEMGLEDYLLNASILGIIAQRIVRKNCEFCSKPYEIPGLIIDKYGIGEVCSRYAATLGLSQAPSSVQAKGPAKGTGCRRCASTGYRGMTAIYEAFRYTEDLKEIFLKDHSLGAIKRRLFQEQSFRTLREDGIIKVLSGITTMEEVLRVS